MLFFFTVHISHAPLCLHSQQFTSGTVPFFYVHVFLCCDASILYGSTHIPIHCDPSASCSGQPASLWALSHMECLVSLNQTLVWFVRSRCEHTLVWTKTTSLREEWYPDSAQLQEVSQTCFGQAFLLTQELAKLTYGMQGTDLDCCSSMMCSGYVSH